MDRYYNSISKVSKLTNSLNSPLRVSYNPNPQKKSFVVEELFYLDTNGTAIREQQSSSSSHSNRTQKENILPPNDFPKSPKRGKKKEKKVERKKRKAKETGCKLASLSSSSPKASPKPHLFRPEKESKFWSTPGVIQAGSTVKVKRFLDGLLDSTYIARKNSFNGNYTIFKIPNFNVWPLTVYMEGILQKVIIDPFGNQVIPGYDISTPTNQLNNKTFWQDGRDTFHALNFWMKPFLSEFGTIQFRIWEEIAVQKHINLSENEMWMGPHANLTLHSVRQIVGALKLLQTRSPERLEQLSGCTEWFGDFGSGYFGDSGLVGTRDSTQQVESESEG